jgi:hypothetical protein
MYFLRSRLFRAPIRHVNHRLLANPRCAGEIHTAFGTHDQEVRNSLVLWMIPGLRAEHMGARFLSYGVNRGWLAW